jgi:hypothetical protein
MTNNYDNVINAGLSAMVVGFAYQSKNRAALADLKPTALSQPMALLFD